MILELFSKRNKPKSDIEIYLYDALPSQFRVQVTYIWDDLFGKEGEKLFDIINEANIYKPLVDMLSRDFGVYNLCENWKHENYGYKSEFFNGFLTEKYIYKAIDYIELSLRIIKNIVEMDDYRSRVERCSYLEVFQQAVLELNYRFDEHQLGYQWVDGKIIRRDNVFTHQEIIKPALEILARKRFKGASAEFHKAHENYRNGKYHESLNECLKAFESTMRIICNQQKWQIRDSATASTLIDICFKNNLIPQFWQSKFTSLRTILESGVPTARNKLSGHGSGSEEKEIPRHLVQYALNITA